MVRRIFFWHSPVVGAVVFMLMTCAVLADEPLAENNLTTVCIPKLHKLGNSVYFYDCWRNSGNGMAVVSNFNNDSMLASGQLAAFFSSYIPVHRERQPDAKSLHAMYLNNLCSTG